MFDTAFKTLAVLIALLGTITPANAQDPPRSGIYQIQSGTYREVGGLVGTYTLPLPASSQAFVSLEIDSGGGAAELTFLGRDQQTVFRRLTNGIMSGNTIQFQSTTVYPYPFVTLPAQVDYSMTNAAGRLWISGSITSSPAVADIPYLFKHQNVQATFVPALSIHVGSEVELRWTSAAKQNYQVQYLSELTQVGWTYWGGLIQGNGTTNSMVDTEVRVQPQRFYRILAPP
jgi:hypothetical protein